MGVSIGIDSNETWKSDVLVQLRGSPFLAYYLATEYRLGFMQERMEGHAKPPRSANERPFAQA